MENLAENISKHFGLPWNDLINYCRKTKNEEPPDPGRLKQDSINNATTRLQKEDAPVFGLRPSLDGCCLTLCGQCGAVIKPQALLSHIERRHKNSNDETSVQHLTIQKPASKSSGSSKSKIKNSPRSSPKLAHEGNVLDKYKLPKPTTNKSTGSKLIPQHTVDRANSALVKHLNSMPTQPIITLNDIAAQLPAEVAHSPTSNNASIVSESKSSCLSTPKSSIASNVNSDNAKHKKLSSKRSLDSSLTELARSQPPKKKVMQTDKKLRSSNGPKSAATGNSKISDDLSSTSVSASHSAIPSKSEPEVTVISTEEFKQPTQKMLMPTTLDKHIPCKDREYDPDRHCGCWLEEWGKQCTRSLTCKSHALSLRRKVPGRSKPFDQLLQEHREAKEALAMQKALDNLNATAKSSGKSERSSTNTSHNLKPANSQRSSVTSDMSAATTSDLDTRAESDHTKIDSLFTSSFHPRPLAASSYGAKLSGVSYIPNRQLDFLRMALTCAIEQPRQIRKVCSSKAMRGGTSSMALASSLAMLQKAQIDKTRANDKKKKAKRLSQDAHPVNKKLNELGVVTPVTKSALHRQEQGHHIALLQSLTTQHNASNPKVNGPSSSGSLTPDTNKLPQKNSMIHLTTTSAGIGSLGKHNMALVDGLPYTILPPNSARQESDSITTSSHQPVLIRSSDKVATNGMVITSGNSQGQTLLELIPPHKQLANIHYIKPDAQINGSESSTTANTVASEKISHLTLTNGSTIAVNPQLLAMQLSKQTKTSVSLTIPLSGQPGRPQQQAILHNTTAAAHPGYT